jgi:hypothetical protein
LRRVPVLGKHRRMTDAPPLLIAWHSRTGGSEALARAAAEGAGTAKLVAAADVTPDALQAAADEAIKLKTGARGLRTILESVLLDVMYEIPSRPEVTKCVVNADTIVRHSQPVLLAGGERAVLWGIEPKEAA